VKDSRLNDDSYLDALLSVPRLGAALVSPDRHWIAWIWSGAGATADVYVAPVDGGKRPIRLSQTDESTVVRSWTEDSRAVVVAQDHGGDERVQLFRIDLEKPGELQPLTDHFPPYFLRGGQIHPNERWLVYAANFDFETGRELETSWVYRHDLSSGERTVLARPKKPSYCVPSLNPDGTHILYERADLDPAGTQVWLVDLEGREDREILNFGDAVKVSASWFPDGRRVLFLAETHGYRRLGVWELNSGRRQWLIDDPGRNLEMAFVPRGCTGETVVVVEVRDARSHASLLHVPGGVEQSVVSPQGNLIPLAPTSDGEWVGQFSSARHPADLIRFHPTRPRTADAVSLTRLWEQSPVRSDGLAAAQDVRWKSVDGRSIQGWLYQPTGVARGTIVQVHGGPTAHSEDEFEAKIQYLVAAGFNVLSPNYRGSTGFGLAFEESIKEDGWGGREQDDIHAGIEALIARGIAQPGKVGITGTSYGGYSSWWAITHWPVGVVAAAAPICGMTDLVVDYYTTRPDLRPYSEEMMGGSPEQVPERYRERSPIHFVRQIQGRLLIVQGLRDPNVTPDNLEVVQQALDREGIEYWLLTFEDEGHGIRKQKNLRVLYRELSRFFAQAFEGHTVIPGPSPARQEKGDVGGNA
jgi:dipeptidyl aminopeptidase/acylaminoacyl peptidase